MLTNDEKVMMELRREINIKQSIIDYLQKRVVDLENENNELKMMLNKLNDKRLCRRNK